MFIQVPSGFVSCFRTNADQGAALLCDVSLFELGLRAVVCVSGLGSTPHTRLQNAQVWTATLHSVLIKLRILILTAWYCLFIFHPSILSPNKQQFRSIHNLIFLHTVVCNFSLWWCTSLKPFLGDCFPAGILHSALSKENMFWQVILTKRFFLYT